MPTNFQRSDTLQDLRQFLDPIPSDPQKKQPSDHGPVTQDSGNGLETSTGLQPMEGVEQPAAIQNFDGDSIYDFLDYSKPSSNLTRTESKNTSRTRATRIPELRFGEGLICVWSDPIVYERIFGDRNATHWDHCDVWKDPLGGGSKDEIPALSLNDCFNEFSTIEDLDGEGAWFCPRCDMIVPAKTTLELWRVPEIFIIQLKRFDPARNRKVDTFIEFPVTDLDLTSRIGDQGWLTEVSKGLPLVYDLFAVANHWGGLHGGHWTASALNYVDGQWYSFNGSSLHQIISLISQIPSFRNQGLRDLLLHLPFYSSTKGGWGNPRKPKQRP